MIYLQIFLCYLAIQCVTTVKSKPIFGELSFKRNFDVLIKPIPFKPLQFVKEKWTPFGSFGIKKGIVKRDLEAEHKMHSPAASNDLNRLPAEVYEDETPVSSRIMVPIEPKVGPIPVSPIPEVGHIQVSPIAEVGHIPVSAIEPIPAPPVPQVVLITPPPKVVESGPVTGLHTDISRDEIINSYLNSVIPQIPFNGVIDDKAVPPIANTIVPEKPKVEALPEEPNPIVRGSRYAYYMANMLFDFLSQFIGRGRLDKPITI